MENLKLYSYIILPVTYILSGMLLYYIVKVLLKSSKKFKINKTKEEKNRKETVSVLLLNIFKYIIGIIVILLTFQTFGVDLTAILAGIGIASLVVGMAFQDIIKDFLAGIFIMTENQFSIGDIVEIKGFKGEVINLGLKTTKLKSTVTGEIKILSNRNIDDTTNFSLSDSAAIVEVTIANKENIIKVEKALLELFIRLDDSIENLTGKIELLGVNKFSETGVVFKIKVSTKPTANYKVERELLREIKLMFEKENIKVSHWDLIEATNAK